MSRQLIPTRLMGREPEPAFWDSLLQRELQNAFDCWNWSNSTLNEALSTLEYPRARLTDVATEDGYFWFSIQAFILGPLSLVIVLFPWAQDWKRSDGSQCDRSPAVYNFGLGDEIEILIKQIVDALNSYREKEEARIRAENQTALNVR